MKSLHRDQAFLVELPDREQYRLLLNRFSECAKPAQSDVLSFHGGNEMMLTVMAYITEQRLTPRRIERIEPSLEALFMEVASK